MPPFWPRLCPIRSGGTPELDVTPQRAPHHERAGVRTYSRPVSPPLLRVTKPFPHSLSAAQAEGRSRRRAGFAVPGGMGEKSLLTLDRRTAYHSPCILGISGCLVLRGKGRHRSMRWRAVRVDQFPVEATVALVDDLEVGSYGRVIALDQRAFPPFRLDCGSSIFSRPPTSRGL